MSVDKQKIWVRRLRSNVHVRHCVYGDLCGNRGATEICALRYTGSCLPSWCARVARGEMCRCVLTWIQT